MQFFDTRILAITPETETTVTVRISLPEGYPSFVPGRYFTLLSSALPEARRSYSFSSTPEQPDLAFTVKRVPDGLFSVWLTTKARLGDQLQISAPDGNFVLPPKFGPRHVIFFAAGSGITPVMSILESASASEPDSRFSLFYGNRSPRETIFSSRLSKLSGQRSNINVHLVYSSHLSESPMNNGRLDFARVTEFHSRFCRDGMHKEYFICGPGIMIESVRSALTHAGVKEDAIHTEFFSSPTKPTSTVLEGIVELSEISTLSEVTAILDKEEIKFALSPDGDCILDALLDLGADAPYSCKGGVCTTCKAKLLEGQVHMVDNYALTSRELKEGYILTCQSHPRTAKVVFTYDGV